MCRPFDALIMRACCCGCYQGNSYIVAKNPLVGGWRGAGTCFLRRTKAIKNSGGTFYYCTWGGDGFRVPAAVESVFPGLDKDVGTRIQRRHVNFPPRIHSLFGDTVTKAKTFPRHSDPSTATSCSSLIERLPVVFRLRSPSTMSLLPYPYFRYSEKA